MGGIPLPALGVQAPQPEGVADIWGKAMTLKNQQLQQQSAQLGIQGQQMQNQQTQMDIQSQQAIQKAYMEAQGDPDKTVQLAAKYGAKPQSILAIKSAYVESATKLASLKKADLDNLQKHNELVGQTVGSALQMPPEQRQSWLLNQGLPSLVQNGVMQPNEAQQYAQQIQQADPAGLDNFLKVHQYGAVTTDKQIKAAQESQAAADAHAKSVAELPGQVADSTKKEAEAAALKQFGGMTPTMAESKYLYLQTMKNQGTPLGKADAAFVEAYEKNKTLVPTANFNLQNSGATGQNGQPSAMAQAVADGSMKWGDVISARTPMAVKQKFLAEVKGVNPNFNSGDFTVEQKVKENFTSGNYSQQLNSINTAREHMKTFVGLADALENGDNQTLNKLGNAIGTEFGSDKVSNFTIAKQAFSSEVGKAFAGASVAEADRKEIGDKISAASSPKQLRGVAMVADELLKGKQTALKQTYSQGRNAQPNFGSDNSQNQNQQDSGNHPFFSGLGGKAK